MSTLAAIQKQILDVDEMLARAQEVARNNPRPSLFAQIRSLEKEHSKLRQEFDAAAIAEEQDVFRYSIKYPDRPTVSGVSAALGGFQNAFAELYVLFKSGPSSKKKRGKLDVAAIEVPQLGWGYEFSGSLGVVMTLPTRVDLWNDPVAESAISALFKIARTDSDNDLSKLAREFGPQAIATVHRWANIHAANEYGVDIEWIARHGLRDSPRLPYSELRVLRDRLATTRLESRRELDGSLIAVDMDTKICRIKSDDGREITATFHSAITEDQAAKVPSRYTATIVTSKAIVAVEGSVPETSNVLAKLSPL